MLLIVKGWQNHRLWKYLLMAGMEITHCHWLLSSLRQWRSPSMWTNTVLGSPLSSGLKLEKLREELPGRGNFVVPQGWRFRALLERFYGAQWEVQILCGVGEICLFELGAMIFGYLGLTVGQKEKFVQVKYHCPQFVWPVLGGSRALLVAGVNNSCRRGHPPLSV